MYQGDPIFLDMKKYCFIIRDGVTYGGAQKISMADVVCLPPSGSHTTVTKIT
jgi:hypothetical protein